MCGLPCHAKRAACLRTHPNPVPAQILKLKSNVGASLGDGDVQNDAMMGGAPRTAVQDARLELDRRFAKRLRLHQNVTFSTDSVVAYTLRIMYKTMYECIRLRTF